MTKVDRSLVAIFGWDLKKGQWDLSYRVQTESVRHYVVHNEWPEHVEVWWKIECFGACGVHRNFSTTQPEFLSQWSFQPNIAELLAPEIVDVWGSWKILHEPNPTHEENNKFRTFEICRRPFHMIPDNGGGAGRFGPCGFEKLCFSWGSPFHHLKHGLVNFRCNLFWTFWTSPEQVFVGY